MATLEEQERWEDANVVPVRGLRMFYGIEGHDAHVRVALGQLTESRPELPARLAAGGPELDQHQPVLAAEQVLQLRRADVGAAGFHRASGKPGPIRVSSVESG